jgi:hypothetical protein
MLIAIKGSIGMVLWMLFLFIGIFLIGMIQNWKNNYKKDMWEIFEDDRNL